MFTFDFIFGDVMDQIMLWIYGKIIGFLSKFFELMGNMGVELFELSFVKSVILFFTYLGWTLYVVGIVIAIFETAIEYQNGRGNIKETSLNIVKGFMAVSLFSILPIELYKLCITLQGNLSLGITGYENGIKDLANNIITDVSDIKIEEIMGVDGINIFVILFSIIMIGYSVIKVFFANLKRGGILLIQISVGSLYMISVPRGYIDGFISWIKQIIALCLTAFLQTTILIVGLMVLTDSVLLGIGLMLSASEVPRIAGMFGLDTSTRANFTGAINTTRAAVSTTNTIINAINK